MQSKGKEYIHSINISQNQNCTTKINLLKEEFFCEYRDSTIFEIIRENLDSLKTISKFIPKIIDFDIENRRFLIDFLPVGSLTDFITFKSISSSYISEFEKLKYLIIYFLSEIVQNFLDNGLIHTNFSPDSILFTNSLLPIIGNIEFIQSVQTIPKMTNQSNHPIYLAPEIKTNSPCAESFSYSLGLLIYSILTMTLVDHIPVNCPSTIPQKFFIFLVRCFLFDPKQRPRVSEIRREILNTFFHDNSTDIESLIYQPSPIHGTKDNVIDLIGLKWPPAFYLIGINFPIGNIFEMTKNEALHFLEIAKSHFENNLCNLECISEIDEAIQNINANPNLSVNVYLKNDKMTELSFKNMELMKSKYSVDNMYGFLGVQMVNDYIAQNYKNNYPSNDMLYVEPNIESTENIFEHQNLAVYQKELIDYCQVIKTRPLKRNVNLHQFTQIGALQVTMRMLADLNPNSNYDLVMITGKGLHSNNQSGKSVLSSTLKPSIKQLIGIQPQNCENQGALSVQITNINDNNNHIGLK